MNDDQHVKTDQEQQDDDGDVVDVETSDETETGEDVVQEPVSRDPYELSKANTGPHHPAANENLRRYIRMIIKERLYGC